MIVPADKAGLAVYYLFWILLYAAIALAADFRSPNTPSFRLGDLRHKHGTLYNAASFASSLLILSGMFSASVRTVAGDTIVPLLLAGMSGMFMAVSDLDPRK